jgi:hypothetical protein
VAVRYDWDTAINLTCLTPSKTRPIRPKTNHGWYFDGHVGAFVRLIEGVLWEMRLAPFAKDLPQKALVHRRQLLKRLERLE